MKNEERRMQEEVREEERKNGSGTIAEVKRGKK